MYSTWNCVRRVSTQYIALRLSTRSCCDPNRERPSTNGPGPHMAFGPPSKRTPACMPARVHASNVAHGRGTPGQRISVQSSASVRKMHALAKTFPCTAAVQQDLAATPTQSLYPTLAPTHMLRAAHDVSQRPCVCPPVCMPARVHAMNVHQTRASRFTLHMPTALPSPTHTHRLSWCFSLTSSLRSGRASGGGCRALCRWRWCWRSCRWLWWRRWCHWISCCRGWNIPEPWQYIHITCRRRGGTPRAPAQTTGVFCFTKFAFRLKWF